MSLDFNNLVDSASYWMVTSTGNVLTGQEIIDYFPTYCEDNEVEPDREAWDDYFGNEDSFREVEWEGIGEIDRSAEACSCWKEV